MFTHNDKYFNELVDGRFGRRIAYCDVEEINESNVVKVVADCIGVFNSNKAAIKYLWNYFKGDQPVLYRKKTIRDDVNNKVVENHAYEIVMFKTGQTYGEPIQIVSLKDNETINKAVELFNAYTRAVNKPAKDIETGTWQSAVGTAFKGIQFTGKKELPFRLVNLSPLNTFVIYSRQTQEPMAAVEELKDADGRFYKLVYTATHEYRIQNSKLMAVGVDENGVAVKSKLHAFGSIPIVEYPNNPERISDIELVITLLDAINNMQSNRSDAIEQFVQSWIKFINCDIDEDNFQKMKQMGAIAVKSNGDNKKVDVEIMSQELKQSESQVAKDDLWNNAMSISAIPNKEGNTGGDTQGAVELRNGWDFSKQRAKLKDPFVIESERKIVSLALNIIRIKGEQKVELTPFDYDVQINHSPTDNLQVKVQSLNLLLSSGIAPLVALKVVGLFEDPQKVYGLSKPYLDNLYKTVEQAAEEKIANNPDLQQQEEKAKQILEDNKNGNDENRPIE